ncbi:MAG: hypothetical protein ACFCBW_18360, partial [Candidatus Competibacterales bacterium]
MSSPLSRSLRPLLWGLASGALVSSNAWSAGTGYLFVSSEKDHLVTVLDGETFEVVKRIPTGRRPRHMQFGPDRRQIYIAASNENSIDIIDVEQLAVVSRIPGIEDPELFDLSPDGQTLYISLEDDGAL